MKKSFLLTALLLMPLAAAHAADMSRYNVIWNSPSEDASGQMPLGNGDIAAGVYAIENGDLYLFLSKNDAFNYMGDIYKTGRVRVSLDPNPFRSGKPFRQTLDLPTGSIQIEADGVRLRVWADALRPVYHVEIASPHELTVNARPEFWRNRQDVKVERSGKLLWYYTVGDRSVYADDLKYYGVEDMATKFPDPYRFNTFGNLLESPDLTLKSGTFSGTGRTFDIRIHALTMQTPKPETWIESLERQAAQPVNTAGDWAKHCAWWTNFWNRSWIIASDRTVPAADREKFNGEPSPDGLREETDGAALVAQNYNVFRYLMACQSRGRIQTKFNGGLFTQPLRGKPGTALVAREDGRLWGRRFTYQNQRHLYWPMLANGDFDLMKPFFDYYFNLLPVRQAITKAWFGHEGAYYRENIAPTGAERDCGKDGRPPKTKPGEQYGGYYHDYYFTCGLETTAMMLDYVIFTGDTGFRDRVLVPFARQVLLFFDKHYARGADGKLRLDPAQVLETWWNAVNPAPDVAGLRFCLDGLLAMKAGTAEDQTRWRKFRAEIPEVPLHTVKGRQAIAPAEIYSKKGNAENGELYPVFPFRCFGVALGTGDLVDWTMENRTAKNAFGGGCWTQDQIHWAFAGNASEAANGLVRRFRIASTMCRFPMYGKQIPDSCPDFDHFGSGSSALQRMLVQEAGAGSKILLLPAWPATWDVDFKLHLSHGAVLTGTVKDGKLVAWDIDPSSRKRDVTVCKPQSLSRDQISGKQSALLSSPGTQQVTMGPASAALGAGSEGTLKLADPFGSAMVLQQGLAVPVWGEAEAGAKVSVSFAGRTLTTTADAQGHWRVEFAALPASAENRVMFIESGASKLELKDVLVGEVWLCSGQSNMDGGVLAFADGKKEADAANDPMLRLRVTFHTAAEDAQKNLAGTPWQPCTTNTIRQGSTTGGKSGTFSAIAYYFGRQLRQELKVPVGLIQSAWDGSRIEPWLPPAAPGKGKGVLAAHRIPPPRVHLLYNGMVAPWAGYAIRGAIWYQGESNSGPKDSPLYLDQMKALVSGWRKGWERSDESFPFYFVQIAPYHYDPKSPEDLPKLWEAQLGAAQTIANTGMAHTQDIGDINTIHPANKQEVGARLARLALSRTYGVKTLAGQPITDDCGPEFKSMEVKGNRVVVSFFHVKSGLSTRDGQPPSLFEVAGQDSQFVPATATISGENVVLTSETVAAPTQVRFGWLNDAEPNLMNGDKLPAASFRATSLE